MFFVINTLIQVLTPKPINKSDAIKPKVIEQSNNTNIEINIGKFISVKITSLLFNTLASHFFIIIKKLLNDFTSEKLEINIECNNLVE